MSGLMIKCNTAKNRMTVDQYLSMFNPYESTVYKELHRVGI